MRSRPAPSCRAVGRPPAWRACLLLAGCLVALSACSGPAVVPPAAAAPQIHLLTHKAPKADANLDPGAPLGRTPAPGFTLTDQFGQRRSLAGYRGHVVLLSFIDSRCTTTCPLTAQMLRDALHLLGPAGRRVSLVAVNANPQATTVQDVLAWSNLHGMTHQWKFLTGPAAQLRKIWKAYHIGVEVDPTTGAVTHTDATYVIDASGRERYLFLTDPNFSGTAPESYLLAKRLAPLLGGGASVAPISSIAGSPGAANPASGVAFTLAAVGGPAAGAQVSAGHGSPRLVAFFATWCQACKEDMQTLRGYAAESAKTAGLPGLSVVDLRVAEPSTQSVRRFVRSQRLPFPVGLDATGKVADAYGVTALPFLAVVSAGGRILWRHVGALPLATLTRDVRGAVSPKGSIVQTS